MPEHAAETPSKTPPRPSSSAPKSQSAPSSPARKVAQTHEGFEAQSKALVPPAEGPSNGLDHAPVQRRAVQMEKDPARGAAAKQAATNTTDIKTYNSKGGADAKGGFESAVGADTGMDADKRNFGGVALGADNPENVQAFYDLNDGRLSMPELLKLDEAAIKRINPIGQSCSARNILHGACQQSWHVAKEQLAGSKEPRHHLIMKKLWEYRQWHHEVILQRTQAAVNAEVKSADGLKRWGAAGSTSLTSDIDVNLKGTHTEKAVEVFNREFLKDGWDYEAGVVYDVNAYALDFMHAPMGVKDDSGELVGGKEGAREQRAVGGFNPAAKKGQEKLEEDKGDQEVWSLLKVRMYMSNPEWDAYKVSLTPTDDKKAATNKQRVFRKVELSFANYQEELTAKMESIAGTNVEVEADAEMHGVDQIGQTADALAQASKKPGQDKHVLAENLKIAASNRVYEDKLKIVATLREALKAKIADYNTQVKNGHVMLAEAVEVVIHKDLVALRTAISESALYSNEAYITDGAINHAVVGLQIGAPIKQSKAESLHAVNENLGDSLKEMTRHGGSLGEAAFKAGKYLWRLADAAKNMDAAVPGVDTLYTVGNTIANVIKKQEGTDQEAASAVEVGKLGVASVGDLKAHVTNLATEVQKKCDTDMRASKSSELGGAVKKD